MSPRCAVPPLQEISLSLVAKQLIQTLSRVTSDADVALQFAMVSSYYETMGTTNDVFQDLIDLILSFEYLDPSIRYYAMRLLLRENVKTLATGIFPCPYYKKVLRLIMEQGRHLTSLNLKGVWVKDLSLMDELLRSLNDLTVLIIPYIANDSVLKLIGEHNKALKLLDVSGDADITEMGINSMLSCNPELSQSLTVVNIGMYGEENIDHTDVALLIRKLPNLTNLGNYSFVGKSIYHIYKNNCSPGFTTKLQYVRDIKTNMKTMKAMVSLCPMIETIYLKEPDLGALQLIKDLDHINKIKLNNFQCEELHQLLNKIGHKIVSLTLSCSFGTVNFSRIAETCRNLETLELLEIEPVTYEAEIPFNKLEHIEIIACHLSGPCSKYLLTGSPRLKELVIADEIIWDDSDMSWVLRHYKFEYLESIWFAFAPRLTRDTVELLMECCPKLQNLGQLNGWQFTPEDMMLMKAIIANTNTDLVLTLNEIIQQQR